MYLEKKEFGTKRAQCIGTCIYVYPLPASIMIDSCNEPVERQTGSPPRPIRVRRHSAYTTAAEFLSTSSSSSSSSRELQCSDSMIVSKGARETRGAVVLLGCLPPPRRAAPQIACSTTPTAAGLLLQITVTCLASALANRDGSSALSRHTNVWGARLRQSPLPWKKIRSIPCTTVGIHDPVPCALNSGRDPARRASAVPPRRPWRQ
jgi:hypothetical protein